AEQLLRAVDRELLDLVHDLAAAVVAPPGVALRVLVRRRRADRLEHRGPREVLRRDQLDLAALAFGLALEERGDVRVDVGQPGGGEVVERLVRDGHTAAPSPFPGIVLAPAAVDRAVTCGPWREARRRVRAPANRSPRRGA